MVRQPGGGFVETMTRSCLGIKHVDPHGSVREVKSDHCCTDACSKCSRKVEENPSEVLQVRPAEGEVRPAEAVVDAGPVASHPAMLSLGLPKSGHQKPSSGNFMEGMVQESQDTDPRGVMLSPDRSKKHESHDLNQATKDSLLSNGFTQPGSDLHLRNLVHNQQPALGSDLQFKESGNTFKDVSNGTPNGHKDGICGTVMQRVESDCRFLSNCCKKPGETKVEILHKEDDNEDHESDPLIQGRPV